MNSKAWLLGGGKNERKMLLLIDPCSGSSNIHAALFNSRHRGVEFYLVSKKHLTAATSISIALLLVPMFPAPTPRSDENYRCSETGYRIPLKCIEIEHDTKNENGKKHSQNGRSAVEISDNLNPHISLQDAASNEGRILLDGSSSAKDGAQIILLTGAV
ncbi:hypothetical protein OIU76_014343 [Salix suchowensis]|uniref:Uncharacterized protein n=1 Tax=Salix suchowensis TaxID=1278906 RepID=A0ABQ9A063_9ROSI|nr:hypothetical protein OIU76_014343 [Salix suchowensis]KAJ6321351.1 hypothetical protein OIU77_011440 [Salix suchowensis]